VRRLRSLRWRLALAFALVATLVTAALEISVYQASKSDRLDRARSVVLRRAQVAGQVYAQTGSFALGAVPAGPSVPAPLRTVVDRGALASYASDGTVWAGVRVRGPARALFVQESYASDQHALTRLRDQLLAIGVVTVLAAALLGLALATRLSSRLRRAAATASDVAAGDLDARIDTRGGDEVATLGAAVNQMADSLQGQIVRERRFAADVAHELRTPVTGLVTAAGLLGPGEPAGMVRERAGALRTLVEELLEISRLESGTEVAELRAVDIAALVRNLARERDGVEVVAVESAHALTDPRRLARVVANLLDNAERHGGPPVTVEVRPGRIEVRDRGPGFTEAMLEAGTERFAKGDAARSGGTGLGLAIASAQLHLLGGSLALANAPGGGAVVTVLLPAGEEPVTEPA
jgi:signal transduction histidine kinase